MKSTWLVLVVVTLVLTVSGDILTRKGEYGQWWYPVPGFFALLGLLGCMAIVVVSKLLGRYWLQRREDYYGDSGAGE
ncbi:MAG: hypothetical protein HYY01_12870 [Chloroflexi bacterium]|nr:hypothetical protein [Chloroflexota bacterium]